MANNVADGFGIKHEKNESLNSLLRKLRESGSVTAEQHDLMRNILSLCNRAVHGEMVSKREADEVIDAASVIASQYLEWLSWGFPGHWTPKDASPT